MSENFTCFQQPRLHEEHGEDYEQRSHIFYKLMPFKVKKVLLVSSLYDAFIVEEEGLIPELVVGEYNLLSLSSPPHVIRVSSGEKALEKLKRNRYDMVVTMSKNIGMDPFSFGRKVKTLCPELPVVLLATEMGDISELRESQGEAGIDKAFFWNGDSSLFLTIIKFVEDKLNAPHDTENGDVRVIIMVEDSVRYYSIFLPLIYKEILLQTRHSLSEELNAMQRFLRRRARPKILLAKNFEEGMSLYQRYRKNVLGVISDVNYPRNGRDDPEAGFHFLTNIKKDDPTMPTLLQSSRLENQGRAQELGVYFLHKHSPTLLKDFRHFLLSHLGFGDFIFLLPTKENENAPLPDEGDEFREQKLKDWLHDSTREIARARSLKEFEKAISIVPDECIMFHGKRNNFSNWLRARGEFRLAKKLRATDVAEFENAREIRDYLATVFRQSRWEKQMGEIIDFSKQSFEFPSSFTRLGGGSLGGKGRGIAFMRTLLGRYTIKNKFRDVEMEVPNTVVIGTDAFDRFMEKNQLRNLSFREMSDKEIAAEFLDARIPYSVKKDLRTLLEHFRRPLAVRSSSLLEDSLNHPFAGIYATYMLPNRNQDDELRLMHLCQGIKLVYASVFYQGARSYIESTAATPEEEKMAIIIQELVGRDYKTRFYPDLSGVAQSYNFYPISRQNYEDGIAAVALGLGKTVVGGGKTIRFSPKHPQIIPEFSTPEQVLQNSQKTLFVLDMEFGDLELSGKEDQNLLELDIYDVEEDGSLEFLVSTYDNQNDTIRDSIQIPGPRLVTLAGVLKYDVFPLAPLLDDILKLGVKSMGTPVEIEFAVTLGRKPGEPSIFSLLQIRPIVTSHEHCEVSWDEDLGREELLLRSSKALGNGVIDDVQDIVYIPPESFDSSRTVEMAGEIGVLNRKLRSSNRPYLLIGPGRWGSQDRWLGVPVGWHQISGVKVMVETALENFDIEPSQGSHFFQNMTSRKIGYITIPLRKKDSFVDWKWLNSLESQEKTDLVRHVRLERPMVIKLDGRRGGALILKP